MLDFNQISLVTILGVIIYLSLYNQVDWIVFFIVCKTLYILVTVNLLHEVIIYNSTSILVCILYIFCIRILKSVIRVLLLIISQNNTNSFFN